MELEIRIKMNEKLYLRDPESSELGKKIIKHSILLINKIGFEDFTFKKLANTIQTTETGIYRYFENKHRLLVYIIAWYWNLIEYQVVSQTNLITDPEKKLIKTIHLLSEEIDTKNLGIDINSKALFQIMISESNKVYLTKNVSGDNKSQLFKPYKDLCNRIAGFISLYAPKYKFPHSLSSTLIETAHLQCFFMNNLPSLTDFGKEKNTAILQKFLEELVFASIRGKK